MSSIVSDSPLSPEQPLSPEPLEESLLPSTAISVATEKLKDMEISPPPPTVDEEDKLSTTSDQEILEDARPPAPVSHKEILKRTLQKKEKVKKDYLEAMCNLETVAGNKKANELREVLSNLELHIKTLTAGLKATNSTSKLAISSGLKISKRDLPKFQLEDSKSKPFPQEEVYKSVDHFLGEFEKIVYSSGQDINDVWKKYIPLTLPYDLDDWMKTVVLKCVSWLEVKSVFAKKFGTVISKLHKKRAVMTMAIEDDETLDEYSIRFFRTAGEAGYHREDSTLGDIFLLSLPDEWQLNISTVLLSRTHQQGWTPSEISTVALNLLGERTPGSWNTSRKSSNPPLKRKFHSEKSVAASVSSGVDLTSELPKARMLGEKNRPNRATKNPAPCRHCGRTWRHGHTCEEYHAAKKQKSASVSVLSVSSASKSEGNENENLENSIKEIYENGAYPCKSKKTNNNNNMKLITPLLLNNRRVIGKVDPGSDISFINIKILNKDFSSIKTIKTNGYLNFLSVNDNKQNSSVTRVGKTEPMEVTYTNNIKFKHEFEVIEFNDELSTEFDVLLGIDILPKLNIYLSGVAFKWPDSDRENELKQFEDINHDPENTFNPEKADYGTPSERKELLALIQPALEKNIAIPSDSACTMPESVVKIKITNPSNCFVRQYPLAVNANAEIKIQLEQWLKDGIVEITKPDPTFHSPLLAVPKRDPVTGKQTKLRICCDLRRINAAISDNDCHENFAIPKIQEIFGRVSGRANIISVLDLKQAYFAYPVSPESRRCLIFSHNNITYQWARAPFGLKFLVSQFVYNMSVLFNGIEQELRNEVKKVYVKENKDISKIDSEFQGSLEHYVDDIVLFSKDVQTQIILINLVVNRLTKVNLRINIDKCSFFQTSVYLLGFVISRNVTKIDTRKLSNIDSWEIPKTTKQVRSIMGIISHLRDYCPMLSKVAAPIDSLRNEKDIKKKWTPLHTDRLERIKRILMSNQILYAPEPSQPYYLQTDASVLGISACLFQKDEFDRIKHIAFASRSLNSAERNWSTNRRETAAIVYGFQKYKPLLWGHNNITVLCDHLALTYLFTSSTLNSTLQSYLEILGEFNFSVSHIKGMENILADRLSRLYPAILKTKNLLMSMTSK